MVKRRRCRCGRHVSKTQPAKCELLCQYALIGAEECEVRVVVVQCGVRSVPYVEKTWVLKVGTLREAAI